jgi:hypothetical protein
MKMLNVSTVCFSQIGDLLISHPGGDELKICDFGLARRIAFGKLAALDYGKILLQIRYSVGRHTVLCSRHS